nr:MAG TPA: hypothetical protein [Caudoviricetes sp.]
MLALRREIFSNCLIYSSTRCKNKNLRKSVIYVNK